MKQVTLSVLTPVLIGLFSACSTSSTPGGSTTVTPTAPTSTLSITFAGKTYNFTTSAGSTATMVNASTASSTSPSSGQTTWGVVLSGRSVDAQLTFNGTKYISPSTAIGTYKSGQGNATVFGTLDLTDYQDGNKRYTSDFTGADTTSTITVATSTATQCKGTFTVTLTFNGHYYPATGNFDYNH